MRIPIPVVILLVITVCGGVWWKNTRHMDFMTPPSAAKLEEVRLRVEAELPPEEIAAVVPPVVVKEPEPPPPPPEPPKPEIDLGDLATPPILQQYGERVPQGTEHLIELANALEEKGDFPRALLAWERVIDLARPDAAQAAGAISSIRRLRPTLPEWNTTPEAMIPIILYASTGKTNVKTLTPVLTGIAHDLEAASSGIVKVKAVVNAGKTSKSGKGPAPVALWLAGSVKKPSSTEVLSFTAKSPETLRAEILKTAFLLIQSQLVRTTAYTPIAALAEGEDPQSALNFRVTRLCWSEFAAGLNLPPKKQP
ncbi:hypothetical protein JIN84_13290 [Luteolibacter yonseiensis]|uniref:Tetratricopeptide repeat protein n=1 Tax=Luteolibacter yonseiensis TaxID=1144680 RepID=A0A934VCK7_9BACT|nr:hypothetical protein [Luteolibacter yonseiensis]MBK1816594.1 hypothetical protein [Luteolibacter yonseiensis]